MGKIVQKIDPDFEMASGQQSPVPESYNFTCFETRVRLIKMVIQEKVKVRTAIKALGLKTSTGKNILKAFREQGKVLLRKQERGQLIPKHWLQDLRRADQILKEEKVKLQKKAKKLQKKKQEEMKETKELIKNQNEVLEKKIPKTEANYVPQPQDCQQYIKQQAEYYQTLLQINMNHQYIFTDPTIKNQIKTQDMMIAQDFYCPSVFPINFP